MKIEKNNKYSSIAAYAFGVIALSIIFYQFISRFDVVRERFYFGFKVLLPFVVGGIMAYLFNFILVFYEEKLLRNRAKTEKQKRAIGIILTYATVAIILYVFATFIVPQITSSILGIANNIPVYIENTSKWFIEVNEKFYIPEELYQIALDKWNEAINIGISYATNLIPKFAGLIRDILSSIWNVILGVIVSTYLLIEKEEFLALSRKIVTAIFSEKNSKELMRIGTMSNEIFGKFIGGKILDSMIIGLLTFVVLSIFRIPYTVLVSFIVGITNVIPFFGPFIGAIPGTIIILFESPIKSLWFIVIIIVIQQIDGNIIGPKILGDSLGISSFWILFSLLVTGKLLGLVGLIIGVPVFAILYSILKDKVEKRLKAKGLPYETEDYKV